MPRIAIFGRAGRLLPFAWLLAAGLACSVEPASGPGLPGHGALELAPLFETGGAGAPVIALSTARARLVGSGVDREDTPFAEAAFAGDSAVLRFDLLVTSPSELFQLEVEALDGGGTLTFRGSDTVRVAPGRTTTRGAPVLHYVAPDTGVKFLVLEPYETVLEAGASLQVSARGFAADETEVAPLNLGWLARDPLAATVSAKGTVEASVLERNTWIVVRTFTGITDSLHVSVRGSIAAIVISPDTAVTIVGSTIPMYAEVKDAAGTVISGEGREVTWTTLDPQIVSISTIDDPILVTEPALSLAAAGGSASFATSTAGTGVAAVAVTGLSSGLARIAASAGKVADTAHVRVEPDAPVAERTEVRPESDTLAAGDTLQLLAESYDAKGTLTAGSYRWIVRDGLVASVSKLGTVVALSPGETWVIAEEAGGTSDSALVVVEQRVASAAASRSKAHFDRMGLRPGSRPGALANLPHDPATWRDGTTSGWIRGMDAALVPFRTVMAGPQASWGAGTGRAESNIDHYAILSRTRGASNAIQIASRLHLL